MADEEPALLLQSLQRQPREGLRQHLGRRMEHGGLEDPEPRVLGERVDGRRGGVRGARGEDVGHLHGAKAGDVPRSPYPADPPAREHVARAERSGALPALGREGLAVGVGLVVDPGGGGPASGGRQPIADDGRRVARLGDRVERHLRASGREVVGRVGRARVVETACQRVHEEAPGQPETAPEEAAPRRAGRVRRPPQDRAQRLGIAPIGVIGEDDRAACSVRPPLDDHGSGRTVRIEVVERRGEPVGLAGPARRLAVRNLVLQRSELPVLRVRVEPLGADRIGGERAVVGVVGEERHLHAARTVGSGQRQGSRRRDPGAADDQLLARGDHDRRPAPHPDRTVERPEAQRAIDRHRGARQAEPDGDALHADPGAPGDLDVHRPRAAATGTDRQPRVERGVRGQPPDPAVRGGHPGDRRRALTPPGADVQAQVRRPWSGGGDERGGQEGEQGAVAASGGPPLDQARRRERWVDLTTRPAS